jgi:hypothetical protein
VRSDFNLAIASLLDDYGVAKISDTAIDLDFVLKELLESAHVEDLVAGRLRSIDDELQPCQTILGQYKRQGDIPSASPWPACPWLLSIIHDLSLLYHAATSKEAGQQQSNCHIHTVDGAIWFD